jgi:hypothetical protein
LEVSSFPDYISSYLHIWGVGISSTFYGLAFSGKAFTKSIHSLWVGLLVRAVLGLFLESSGRLGWYQGGDKDWCLSPQESSWCLISQGQAWRFFGSYGVGLYPGPIMVGLWAQVHWNRPGENRPGSYVLGVILKPESKWFSL